MANIEALLARAEEYAKLLRRVMREGKRIAVVTHIDADGLSSGAIAFQSIAREGAQVSVRAIADLDPKAISQLKEEGFDFLLFTDLASGLLDDLSRTFGNSFMVVDHHQLPAGEFGQLNLLNAWQFGYDGGSEACSSTMAYVLATALNDDNKDLSHLAIVGAVGDRQDCGTAHGVTGLNKRGLDDATSLGLVSVSKDFLFHGRETRPVHEALAMTYSPFIPALSGSKDVALAALSNAGFKLKEGGRWRTLSELTNEEKQKLLDVLARYLAPTGTGSDAIADLIGEVYSLQLEDSFTPLKDAREFATLLNACGRMDRADIGLAVCLGDRDAALAEALKISSDYRTRLNRAIQLLQTEEGKVNSKGDLTIVIGDDFLEERLTGSISSILASSTKFRDRVVMVRAKSGDTELKFSTRLGDGFTKKVNLGELMRETALEVGGLGGGHSMAAGAKVPISRGDDFARILSLKVSQ